MDVRPQVDRLLAEVNAEMAEADPGEEMSVLRVLASYLEGAHAVASVLADMRQAPRSPSGMGAESSERGAQVERMDEWRTRR